MIEVSIECDECFASCCITHDLHENLYELTEECPFCGSDNIVIVHDEAER